MNNPISKTGLDYIERSPLDYWWKFVNPQRDPYVKSKDTLFDEALRMSVFQPELFAGHYVQYSRKDERSQIAKSENAAMQRATAERGQEIMSPSDFQKITEIRQSLLNHSACKEIIGNGTVGQAVRFTASDVEIKLLPHWIYAESVVIYLYTDTDPSETGFIKNCANSKHYKRAALQMDALGVEEFIFIVCGKESPHKIGVYQLDDRAVNFGREQYLKNCEVYAQCLKSNIWPGPPQRIEVVSLPEWALK